MDHSYVNIFLNFKAFGRKLVAQVISLKSFFILIFFASLILTSCEKVIDVDLDDAETLLVIEGTINNHIDTQVVRITSSVKMGASNVFPGIKGAIVTVTDDLGITYNFREREPGLYTNRRLRGMPGRTYNLKVAYDGKEYTSVSTMPNVLPIDSIGFSRTTIFNNTRTSVQVVFNDPPQVKNFYRFLLTVNGVKSKSIFVYSDDFSNGNYVTRELFDDDIDLKAGDTVFVEMQCISQPVYKYWLGLDQNENRGGASITPANPVSNISNGALGYFNAHTQQMRMVVVPFLN